MKNTKNFNDRNPRGLASPCLNCGDRNITCHSKCAKYAEFRKRNDELRKLEFEQNRLNAMQKEEMINAMRKSGRPRNVI